MDGGEVLICENTSRLCEEIIYGGIECFLILQSFHPWREDEIKAALKHNELNTRLEREIGGSSWYFF